MPHPGRVGTCSARCAQVSLNWKWCLDRLPKCTRAPLFFSESTGPDRGVGGGRVPCPTPPFSLCSLLWLPWAQSLLSSPTRGTQKKKKRGAVHGGFVEEALQSQMPLLGCNERVLGALMRRKSALLPHANNLTQMQSDLSTQPARADRLIGPQARSIVAHHPPVVSLSKSNHPHPSITVHPCLSPRGMRRLCFPVAFPPGVSRSRPGLVLPLAPNTK